MDMVKLAAIPDERRAAVPATATADALVPTATRVVVPMTEERVAEPTQTSADVLREAHKTVGHTAVVGAAAGGTLLGVLGLGVVVPLAVAGAALTAAGGAAVGVGVVTHRVMNCDR